MEDTYTCGSCGQNVVILPKAHYARCMFCDYLNTKSGICWYTPVNFEHADNPIDIDAVPVSEDKAMNVRAIRALRRQGVSQVRLAKKFGYSKQSVHLMVNYKQWKHV